jgi:hypothetical protein
MQRSSCHVDAIEPHFSQPESSAHPISLRCSISNWTGVVLVISTSSETPHTAFLKAFECYIKDTTVVIRIETVATRIATMVTRIATMVIRIAAEPGTLA